MSCVIEQQIDLFRSPGENQASEDFPKLLGFVSNRTMESPKNQPLVLPLDGRLMSVDHL